MYQLYLDLAEKLVTEGGEIALANFQQQKFATEWKADHSLVTNTDTQIETLWREKIRKQYPDHQVFGEEFGGEIDTEKPTWIFDPLDGTTNFSHDIPLFCSMASLQIKDKIVCAAVSSPIQNMLFSAQLGGGATINHQPFPPLSTETNLANVTLLLDSGKAKRARDKSYTFLSLFGNTFRSFRKFGCMVAPLVYAAHSRLDVEVIFEVDLYDVAGLSLIFQEAGYVLLGHDGQTWQKTKSADFIVTTPRLQSTMSQLTSQAEVAGKSESHS